MERQQDNSLPGDGLDLDKNYFESLGIKYDISGIDHITGINLESGMKDIRSLIDIWTPRNLTPPVWQDNDYQQCPKLQISCYLFQTLKHKPYMKLAAYSKYVMVMSTIGSDLKAPSQNTPHRSIII